MVTEPIASNRVGGIESFRVLEAPAGSGVDVNNVITIDAVSNPDKYYLDLGKKNEPQKTGNYIVEYCFKNAITGCMRCDTSIVNVISLPKIKFDSIPGMCINQAMVTLDSIVRDSFTGKRLSAGIWQCIEYNKSRDLTISSVKNAINNSVYQQHYFKPKTGSGTYLLKYTDFSSGCSTTDSIEVSVYGLPQIKLFTPDTVCANSGKYKLQSNYSYNDANGKWSGSYVVNSDYNSDSVVLANQYAITRKMTFGYTNPLTKCSDTAFTYRTAVKRPYFKFMASLHGHYLVDFLMIDSNMNLKNFKWLWYYGNGDTSTRKYSKDIVFKDSGDYKTYLNIYNGFCITTDSLLLNINYHTLSIQDIIAIPKIYPNPVTDILNIVLPMDAEVKLFDMNGKFILKTNIDANQTNQINIADLKSGIYMLSIINGGLSYWVKLAKTN
ncbi:MAG: T9SS type A sorting domain-containing protein [bacterium]|nr:T9SS type A sorting domain-containing protein [bacterium]